MWIQNEIADAQPELDSGITIGAFDGVHLGHSALIRKMVAGSTARGLAPVVVTFDPLPGQVLEPEAYHLLSSLEERLDRIASLGVQGTVILPFDRAFMETPAGSFVDRLRDHLGMRAIWIGPDFALGRAREGNAAFLQRAGRRMGFSVHLFEETIRWEEAPVRSSRIRDALRVGNIREANGCLGYPYRLSGTIAPGDQRGRTLGFPTANLSIAAHRLLPANGVYICRVELAGSRHIAITNVGTRPTFDNGQRKVEAYLLDFNSDIYGAEMHLDFLERLRPELRFTSVEALIEQMVEDEATTRSWLHANSGSQTLGEKATEPTAEG